MENLAIELIEKIAAFASTDAGRTAISLSLTSRYIREATRAIRFHSVSLTKNSEKQLSQFLAHFRAEQAALADRTAPRIRHLCIAPVEGAADICRMAAPDLYTLALIQGSNAAESDPEVILLNGVDFPLLRELTIFGVGSEFGVLAPYPKLPSLRRLHILPVSSKKLQLISAPDLRLWSQRAPEVTHLRVAFTDDKNAVLKAQLENIAAPELLGLPVMFPKLEEVLVQPTYVKPLKRKRGLEEHSRIKIKFRPSSTVTTRPLTLLPEKMVTIGELDAEVEPLSNNSVILDRESWTSEPPTLLTTAYTHSQVLFTFHHPSSNMATPLPVELLTQIFTYACTDGGHTGYSLLLVSKHIRAVSSPLRFHSISLTRASVEQVIQFSSCLLAERALSKDTGATPRVRHLCLTAVKRSVIQHSLGDEEEDTEQLEFNANVMTLLAIVAPDLLTLSLVAKLPFYVPGLSLPDIRRVSFPVLQELSITSDHVLFSLADLAPPPSPVGASTVFPNLTHLHWTCEDFPSRNVISLYPWIAAAPRLTHFRISNLNRRSEGLVQLRAAIAPDDGMAPWFPNLEHIVVQPSTPPAIRRQSPYPHGFVYTLFVDTLRLLQNAAKCQFSLLAGRERRIMISQEGPFGDVAKREWLDRIAGGRGCWDTRSSGDAVLGTPDTPHTGV
ncbi:hypothetical protein GSI_01216 [Ganoderma sinense ZZ0214-1]|uniref:F-box domain-containing protein n=1 Tax=Ganoderma sinense ZZ0214-1 TaxID=1077348 RepID=A0A2G8SUW8_9APHY|nr:hypothetical protein GSI_01216 [Ganoderma sinense ZZ0214-1]